MILIILDAESHGKAFIAAPVVSFPHLLNTPKTHRRKSFNMQSHVCAKRTQSDVKVCIVT